MKKIITLLVCVLLFGIGGCSLFNKTQDTIEPEKNLIVDETLNENIEDENLIIVQEDLESENKDIIINKEIDENLEKKVDKLIQEAKTNNDSSSSGLTEKDIDLIDKLLNEITDSIEETGASN